MQPAPGQIWKLIDEKAKSEHFASHYHGHKVIVDQFDIVRHVVYYKWSGVNTHEDNIPRDRNINSFLDCFELVSGPGVIVNVPVATIIKSGHKTYQELMQEQLKLDGIAICNDCKSAAATTKSGKCQKCTYNKMTAKRDIEGWPKLPKINPWLPSNIDTDIPDA